MIRLFDRGHREEARFEKWVADISDKFYATDPRTGQQIRISDFNGYFGGSLDGIVVNPAGVKGNFLTEFKTHSKKSFDKLVLHSVKKAKPEHYTQMQVYLHYKEQLAGALYFAICKDDDSLYIEFVARDTDHAKEKLQNAANIIMVNEPPPPHNAASSWDFTCRYCTFASLCYKNAAPELSCRSCSNVELTETGWYCNAFAKALTLEDQLTQNCKSYERLF
jgi:ribosomal protein S27E